MWCNIVILRRMDKGYLAGKHPSISQVQEGSKNALDLIGIFRLEKLILA